MAACHCIPSSGSRILVLSLRLLPADGDGSCASLQRQQRLSPFFREGSCPGRFLFASLAVTTSGPGCCRGGWMTRCHLLVSTTEGAGQRGSRVTGEATGKAAGLGGSPVLQAVLGAPQYCPAFLSPEPFCAGHGQLSLPGPGEQARKSKAKPNGKKPAAEEKKVYLEPEYTKSRITDFGFKELVVLPREIDLNEWLASNTTTFFHHVNLQYSTISEFCTGEACQTMAVCNTQYYWYDERGKKVKCTAPQYVDFVMSSVQKLVTDEDVFPTKYGREFPSSFESLVKKICKYLFHVLAHIYSSHFKETLALELHGHLNTLYVHFILFAREFNLLDPKETAVMDDLTEVLCSGGGRGGGGGDAAGGAAGAQNHVKER
uniref:MOB kinase activator 2 n=1 Tax=Sus scrofa TaxID=9823 RepID=A0A8D1DSF3_PIG